MRISLMVLALLVFTGAFASADQPDDATLPTANSSATAPAPADEYFGRLKMSILGIRNQLNRLTAQVDADPLNSQSARGSCELTEESIKEWEQKYPSDPWLAKTVYMLVHLYAKMPAETGHTQALRVLSWLLAKYPGSEFTETALAEVRPASEDPAAPHRR